MSPRDTVLLVTGRGMGHGPEELQLTLFGKYLQLLEQAGDLPAAICFYTDGVKLVAEGSPVLGRLQALEAKGVRLIVCSTCLDFYGLDEKVKVGLIGGMSDILEAQLKAGKVLSI